MERIRVLGRQYDDFRVHPHYLRHRGFTEARRRRREEWRRRREELLAEVIRKKQYREFERRWRWRFAAAAA